MLNGFNTLRKQLKKEDIVKATKLELLGKLEAYKDLSGLTYNELAKQAGASDKELRGVEEASGEVSFETIILLADSLGYELELINNKIK
ncbi:helix-turn-helix transcriptional regulator [Priestia filamentosa]|uniref:helix-turn-helix domain-containing protein n=1 Tax=Priestia filamentosa TaxID=1402861 RepID=UPI00398252C6